MNDWGAVMRCVESGGLNLMQWHLVLCKPNQHNIAHRTLSRLPCEVFLPQQAHPRRWCGRVLTELRPVFPGYLFVGTDPAQPIWSRIRAATGVSRLIGFGESGPARIPPQIFAGLMARCDSDGLLAPLPEDFSAGDHIRITSGPFADFVARVDTVDPQHRLHLLGRPTKVVVEPEMATRTA